MKKNKNFLYLFILLLFIIFLYSQEQCYRYFGDIFGISGLPIETYGFFIAMAFLFGALFLQEELRRLGDAKKIQPIKRKQKNKLISNVFNLFLIPFFIGYQLPHIIQKYSEFLNNKSILFELNRENSGDLSLSLILGIIFMILAFYLNKKNKTITKEFIKPHELIGTLLGVTLISGILGAKLFYLFETEMSWKNLFSFGGLTFYGGLICGTLGVIFYAKKNQISIPHIADAFAPILMLSYAIGRVGCQVSGDGCWGIPNTKEAPSLIPDFLWSSQYVNGSSSGTNMLDANIFVWPTPIYETIMCLIIFGILWSIRRKIKIGGLLFSIYLVLNGMERFFIEFIRVNEKLIFNLTQGQVIAITLFLIGTILSLYLLTKKKNAII